MFSSRIRHKNSKLYESVSEKLEKFHNQVRGNNPRHLSFIRREKNSLNLSVRCGKMSRNSLNGRAKYKEI